MNIWSVTNHQTIGATMTIGKCWGLATAWYHDRLSPDFHRRTVEQALAIFAELSLTGPFWSPDTGTPTP